MLISQNYQVYIYIFFPNFSYLIFLVKETIISFEILVRETNEIVSQSNFDEIIPFELFLFQETFLKNLH